MAKVLVETLSTPLLGNHPPRARMRCAPQMDPQSRWQQDERTGRAIAPPPRS
jgi:hypothetical protein